MRPTIGITSGDPAGVGLEVILRSVAAALPLARCVLFTDRAIFQNSASKFAPNLNYRWIEETSQIGDDPVLFLRDLGGTASNIEWGRQSSEAGRRALAYLEAASNAALAAELDGIVTAPVNKEAIGEGFRGQTDFLAERARVQQYAMAFFAPTFKVVLATIHVSLREALTQISTERYIQLIRFVHSEFPQENIAVAAVNPHAGEGGIFGREDLDLIAPAVRQCAAEGIPVSGPHSADSLYYRAHSGEFAIVIAPYHDQGLIPVKLIAHGESTNVTLGLPYVRTSPDHGTAFSIAGKGEADPSGMKTAMLCAVDLIGRRYERLQSLHKP